MLYFLWLNYLVIKVYTPLSLHLFHLLTTPNSHGNQLSIHSVLFVRFFHILGSLSPWGELLCFLSQSTPEVFIMLRMIFMLVCSLRNLGSYLLCKSAFPILCTLQTCKCVPMKDSFLSLYWLGEMGFLCISYSHRYTYKFFSCLCTLFYWRLNILNVLNLWGGLYFLPHKDPNSHPLVHIGANT